jgi:large-conductance mechanosensitive channel
MMDEKQPPRFRFRLRALLFVIAFLALLIVAVIQQVQIARLRRELDARAKQTDQLTTMLRELRDHLSKVNQANGR